MRVVTRSELADLIERRAGLLLVDHVGRGADHPSTLHAIGCRWARRTNGATPLRFGASERQTLRWLRAERGEEGDGWTRCRECGGVAVGDPEPAGRWLPGETVWAAAPRPDLAVVVSDDGSTVEVEAFDGPAAEAVARRTLPRAQTSGFRPSAGDRCFLRREGVWRAARVLAVPNADTDAVAVVCEGEHTEVPARELRYRRLAPLADPLGELAEQRAGELDRFRARARLARLATELAASAGGLPGIPTAAVSLHPHQVGVARRVLSDPVQRYLLADEVGLGKTIEAGFVIRQRLLDAPRSTVLVLVPPSLVWQWEQELETKFALGDVGRGVQVASYDDPAAFRRVLVPDLVVVDEAQRIAAGWESPVRELADRYEAARVLSHRVPRLLLLSATPVLHRERDLLAMLHLLDPDAHPLEDVEAFTRLVRDRERTGRSLVALRPRTPAFLLGPRLPELREAFPRDERLASLLDELEGTLADEDDGERERVLAETRVHVTEHHRLHGRLLRNRRTSIDADAYAVRGRAGVEVVADDDDRRATVDVWLDRWRAALSAGADERSEDEQDAAARVFSLFAERATGDLETLRDLAAYRLTRRREAREAAGLAPEEAAVLRGFALGDAQRAVLGDLGLALGDAQAQRDVRMRAQAAALARRDEEAVVVFATAPATLDALAGQLRQLAPETDVSVCSAALGDRERRATVTAFVEGGGRRLLLCDRSGEEGLNLQCADAIVHLDLPWRTVRLEQRAGRADRLGERGPVRSVVLGGGPTDGYASWWLRAVRDVFHVFDRSTATLQYAIETVERELRGRLFEEGLDAAEAALADAERRVEEEQERIDRLDGLDALSRQEHDDVAFVERVRTAEERLGRSYAEALRDALTAEARPLGARQSPVRDGVWQVEIERLGPPLHALREVAGRPLTIAETRADAVGRAPRLAWPGTPLADAVARQGDWDVRAQTAVVWCQCPGPAELAVRCDVVVAADATAALAAWRRSDDLRPDGAGATRSDADAPLAPAALERRLAAYLPPTLHSLWIGARGRVLDGEEAGLFEEALASGPARPWPAAAWRALHELSGALSIADLLATVRRSAQDAAAELVAPDLMERARARAERDWAETARLLEARVQHAREAEHVARDLEAERVLAAALLEALGRPVARWHGACVVVRSSTPLPVA